MKQEICYLCKRGIPDDWQGRLDGWLVMIDGEKHFFCADCKKRLEECVVKRDNKAKT